MQARQCDSDKIASPTQFMTTGPESQFARGVAAAVRHHVRSFAFNDSSKRMRLPKGSVTSMPIDW